MASESIILELVTHAQKEGILSVLEGLEKVKESAMEVAGSLIGLAGGVLSIGGFFEMTKGAIENAEAMEHQAQKAGLNVEQFSALAYAGELVRVSSDRLILAGRGLTKWMESTGQAGRDLLEVLLEQADHFAAMPDGLDKVREANVRFGRSGVELIPLLNLGSVGIRKYMEEAGQLNVVVGEGFANSASEFSKNIVRVKEGFKGIFNTVAQELLPSMIDLQKSFLDWFKSVNQTIPVASILNGLLDAMAFAFGLVAVRAAVASGAISAGLFAALTKSFQGFDGLVGIMGKWSSAIALTGSAFAGWEVGKWINDLDNLGKGFGGFGKTFGDVMQFQILQGMATWERFKMMMGGGSKDMMDAINKSMREISVPLPARPKSEEVKKEKQGEDEFTSEKLLLAEKLLALEEEKGKLEVERMHMEGSTLLTEQEGLNVGIRKVGSLQDEAKEIKNTLEAMRSLLVAQKEDLFFYEKKGAISEEQKNQKELALKKRIFAIDKEIYDLKVKTNDFSFGEKMLMDIKVLQDEFRHLGAAIADTLVTGIKNAISTVSTGIWQVIDGTSTWGKLFLQVGRQIISSLIQIAIQHFIVDNIMRAISVAWLAFRKAIGWAEQADHAAQKTTEVGVHTAAETTKTGTTATGAFARGAIRLGETIFHGIMAVARAAAHIASEIAMTTATLIQAAIRMPVTILEAGKDLVVAAFKAASAVADIPYVGPILAIAAMAAIIGAGVKYMGGFEQGGVIDGPKQLIHVNENGTESILNARATAMLGEDMINQMNAGVFDLQSRTAMRMPMPGQMSLRSSAMPLGSGGALDGGDIHHHFLIVDSERSQAARDFVTGAAGRAHIIHTVMNAKTEIGIRS